MTIAARSATGAEMQQRTVRFRTSDGVTIVGTYTPAKQKPAPVALLIHSIARNRSTWDDLVKVLQQNDISALAIDLRGHGESTGKTVGENSETLDFRSFVGRDYMDMQLDIEAAVDWLEAQPEIDRKHIALVGESLGANLVLRYAAINEDIAAVVAFSPGINYRDVRTDDVVAQLGRRPLRIFVSQYDAFAYESCGRLIEIQKEAGIETATNALQICTGNLHGSNMLRGVRNLPQITVNWLKTAFAPVAPPAGETAKPPK